MIYFSLHRVKPTIAAGLNVASAPFLSFIPFDRLWLLHLFVEVSGDGIHLGRLFTILHRGINNMLTLLYHISYSSKERWLWNGGPGNPISSSPMVAKHFFVFSTHLGGML
jgi:hypothetical protein